MYTKLQSQSIKSMSLFLPQQKQRAYHVLAFPHHNMLLMIKLFEFHKHATVHNFSIKTMHDLI
jgi:hypothetical protein